MEEKGIYLFTVTKSSGSPASYQTWTKGPLLFLGLQMEKQESKQADLHKLIAVKADVVL